MKKYIKPSVEILAINYSVNVMQNSIEPEPEVTENIGAKESNFFDWDDSGFSSIWDDEEDDF